MMYNPVSTYRIQFHKEFTLADLERRIDYFIGLGIGTIYASPLFTAVPGSNHGYDALNPLEISPEIGTLEELRRISGRLRAAGIGWLQDIVPNHMAYDPRNPWLRDLLEKGRHSAYADFFDVAWNDAAMSGHIMAPFLGKSLEDSVRGGEIKLVWEEGRLGLAHGESVYPVRLRTYQQLLDGEGAGEAVRQWLEQARELHENDDASQYATRFEELLQQLTGLLKNATVAGYFEKRLASVTRDELLGIACEQVYRLCHWQETDGRINYRRFFTVNGLICLNMQQERGFAEYHRLIAQLVAEGVFAGVRVDHVDGLYDPGEYLQRLRDLLGPECYIVVEKILALNEALPAGWPIEGTTGYDFLGQVNQLLTDPRSEAAFTRFYYNLDVPQRSVAQLARDKKSYILYRHMGGELENLYQLLMQGLQPDDYARMRTEDLKTAIAEVLIHMPVYRFYADESGISEEVATKISDVLTHASISRPDLLPALDLLGRELRPSTMSGKSPEHALRLFSRMMQLSGPLAAKGVEDTLMYTYFNFLGHNDVGDSPEKFGIAAAGFHGFLQARAQWPLTMNATSTHDTKRGEDARARLQALSSMAGEWIDLAGTLLPGDENPDANDRYLLLQTLAATMPEGDADDYGNRVAGYLEKALRESKRRSNWAQPDEVYERSANDLAAKWIVAGSDFRLRFENLQKKLNEFGLVQSLVQLAIKGTAPGVPDFYQGCEGPDFSLVDPDNRRAVDYDSLERGLSGKKQAKFNLTKQLLRIRRENAGLFARGRYRPLEAGGAHADHVFAFARILGSKAVITVVPLHAAGLAASWKEIDWADTHLVLPEGFGEEFIQIDNKRLKAAGGRIPVSTLWKDSPVAVLSGEAGTDRKRSAGLLLHVTSLPGPFGIGDLGPESRRFVDFLSGAGQRIWQLLPVAPTETGQGNSPYSSPSAFAGNRLLISPELLVEAGLLTREEIDVHHVESAPVADFEEASRIKDDLLSKAWSRFAAKPAGERQNFKDYCNSEKDWLDDYALFTVLKSRNGGKPWYEWPDEWKLRTAKSMTRLLREEETALDAVRWEQFEFDRQWKLLKNYAHDSGIKLIGDLPFYVSYDSADVWAHRDLFQLDKEGGRLGMAGVPPDAFSDDGQLWGMPVYDWAVLKSRNYGLWAARLRRNADIFDLVRLDHFRAFSAYWEVPPGSATAKTGKWMEGPGAPFFESIREQLGDLPFIAEDLGDIDEAVLRIRDGFGLPGMKVLQFAFGDNLPRSEHIPHNYGPNFLAYPGTHDNDTTLGWYRAGGGRLRAQLAAYAGRAVADEEVAAYICRLALSSVADTAILPVQDLLGLDADARMNKPATASNNWGWRLLPGQLDRAAAGRLREWTELFNRS